MAQLLSCEAAGGGGGAEGMKPFFSFAAGKAGQTTCPRKNRTLVARERQPLVHQMQGCFSLRLVKLLSPLLLFPAGRLRLCKSHSKLSSSSSSIASEG